MADLVLIHGACLGAWIWDGVLAELAARGHSARAVDLPGRGGTDTSLAAQAKAVAEACRQPSVLVGHSAGGFAATAAAQMVPDRVAGVIYLCAYVPRPGLSIADLRRAGPSQPMRGSFQLTADRRAFAFRRDRAADLFFHDCADPEAAMARMCLEPVVPQETALPGQALPPAMPRAAVICTDDRAIPPTYQREMAAGMPQHDLPSGHSPFLSMPGRLAALIADIAAGFPGTDQRS